MQPSGLGAEDESRFDTGRQDVSPIRAENRARYPADWRAISKRLREQRAGNRCECDGRCGHPHEARCEAVNGQRSPYTGSLVVLTVAHLDHHPENCDEANLLVMCQRCHLGYDRDQHAQTRALTKAAEPTAQMDSLFDTDGGS